jgi:hypothetical protein
MRKQYESSSWAPERGRGHSSYIPPDFWAKWKLMHKEIYQIFIEQIKSL